MQLELLRSFRTSLAAPISGNFRLGNETLPLFQCCSPQSCDGPIVLLVSIGKPTKNRMHHSLSSDDGNDIEGHVGVSISVHVGCDGGGDSGGVICILSFVLFVLWCYRFFPWFGQN